MVFCPLPPIIKYICIGQVLFQWFVIPSLSPTTLPEPLQSGSVVSPGPAGVVDVNAPNSELLEQ